MCDLTDSFEKMAWFLCNKWNKTKYFNKIKGVNMQPPSQQRIRVELWAPHPHPHHLIAAINFAGNLFLFWFMPGVSAFESWCSSLEDGFMHRLRDFCSRWRFYMISFFRRSKSICNPVQGLIPGTGPFVGLFELCYRSSGSSVQHID